MVYATWDFYTGTYAGSIVPQDAFVGVVRRASAELDKLTYARIDGRWAAKEAVKMACCAMCDVLYAAIDTKTGKYRKEITQERLDYHSVTYEQAGEAKASLASQLLEAARLYLWGTGLLSQATKYREGCTDGRRSRCRP